jgi:hypothetical protein
VVDLPGVAAKVHDGTEVDGLESPQNLAFGDVFNGPHRAYPF